MVLVVRGVYFKFLILGLQGLTEWNGGVRNVSEMICLQAGVEAPR